MINSKKYIIPFYLAVIFLNFSVHAEEIKPEKLNEINKCECKEEEKIEKTIFDVFYIANSFQSGLSKLEPAIITLTMPLDGQTKNNYLINGAIGFSLENVFDIFTIIPNIEYRKNTLIEAEQDNLSLGFLSENVLIPSNASGEGQDRRWQLNLLNNINYNHNFIDNSDSLQFLPYVYPYFLNFENADWLNFLRPVIDHDVISNFFSYNYTPYVGLEAVAQRTNLNALNPKNTSFFNGYFRFNSVLKFEILNGFDLNIDYQFRYSFYDANDTSIFPIKSLFKISLNGVLYKQLRQILPDNTKLYREIKLGLDYVNGEDPIKNLKQQQSLILALKFQL